MNPKNESTLSLNDFLENPYKDINEDDFLRSNHSINGFNLLTLNRTMDNYFESLVNDYSHEVTQIDNTQMINKIKLISLIDNVLNYEMMSIHEDRISCRMFNHFRFIYNTGKSFDDNVSTIYYNTSDYSSNDIRRILFKDNLSAKNDYDILSRMNLRYILDVISLDLVNKNGKFSKRFSKEFKNLFGIKLSDSCISKIGNSYDLSLYSPDKIYYRIQRDINWDNGDFGKDDSCWWNMYGTSRSVFTNNGGFAILRYREINQINYDEGIGRIWIMPLTSDSFIAFNAYGFSNKESNSVLNDLGKRVFNVDDIYIKKARLKFINSIPYINTHEDSNDDNNIWIISNNQNVNEINKIKITFNIEADIYESFSKCEFCDCTYSDSNLSQIDNYGLICDECRDEHFYSCDICNRLVRRDDINYIESDDSNVCQRCLNDNYSRCDNCDEVFNDNDLNEFDNLSLCESCYQSELESQSESNEDSNDDRIEHDNDVSGIQLSLFNNEVTRL